MGIANSSKNRAIVLAVTEGGFSPGQAAQRFQVSARWVRILLGRYRQHGLDGLEPRSRRPHTNPNATSSELRERILALRVELLAAGLDAGPESIGTRLPEGDRVSRTTIWRILTQAGAIEPQPQKRPRSSWHRFEAAAPNGMWQSDFTHVRLADGTDTEVISWLDDHSRYLLHISCHRRVTGPVVVESFLTASDIHGLPAATLTDNGMVYTTRLSRGSSGKNSQPNAFETLIANLGIIQKNGRPGHPTTQGKIERFHQTLKLWLTARPPAEDLAQLQELLDEFTTIYNTHRPHRALGQASPHTVYTTGIKDAPRIEIAGQPWRVRYDLIDQTGTITIRYAGRLRHLGIGRAHTGTRVIALAHGPEVIILTPGTGEIIAQFRINPTKNYQPKITKPDPRNGTMTRDTQER